MVRPLIVTLAMAVLTAQDAKLEFFEKQVRPILVMQCYACHGPKAKIAQGGLRVDYREALLRGGHSGAAVVPGKPDESRLIQAVRHAVKPAMPPWGKLKPEQIAALEQWVAQGAVWPDEAAPTDATAAASAGPDRRAHWAWQPVRDPAPPTGPANLGEIDRFLHRGLEQKKLSPNPPADPATLLRRLSLDLTGLPPSREAMLAFVADPSPAAYTRVVDQLLAAPEFGERWGRHWLDVTYYGDTLDAAIPATDAWRYRDYVIRSFNTDKPINRFIREQIAGDLLPHQNGLEQREQIIATGYLALGPWALVQADKEQLRMDVIDLQIDAIGKGLLGLTVSCARCHDHKFDPVAQKEYFGLAGILGSTRTIHGKVREAGVFSDVRKRPLYETPEEIAAREQKSKAYTEEIAALEARMQKLEAELAALAKDAPKAERAALDARIATLGRQKLLVAFNQPTQPSAHAVDDVDTPADCKINIRGNAHQLAEVTPRTFVQVAMFGSGAPQWQGSGRLELANWIADDRNPLTARVYVNRVWQHLFGTGIVRSADNFGLRGELPTHPELLDHLATTFLRSGWSTKQLVRRLVMTRAYQMSAAANTQAEATDPENRLLWRMNRRRLDAESIRDGILMLAGRLDRTRGGPTLPLHSLDTFSPEGGKVNPPTMRVAGALPESVRYRRTLYLPVYRGSPVLELDLMSLFDAASNAQVTATRNSAVIPTQALYLLNSPWVREQAQQLARTLPGDTAFLSRERARWLIETIYGRPAREKEIDRALDFVAESEQSAKKGSEAAGEAWTQLIQSLLISNEFLFRS
jgi:ribosomal protein S21